MLTEDTYPLSEVALLKSDLMPFAPLEDDFPEEDLTEDDLAEDDLEVEDFLEEDLPLSSSLVREEGLRLLPVVWDEDGLFFFPFEVFPGLIGRSDIYFSPKSISCFVNSKFNFFKEFDFFSHSGSFYLFYRHWNDAFRNPSTNPLFL